MTDETAEFQAAAAEGRFLLRYSEASGRYYPPHADPGLEPQTTLVWKPAAGTGKIVSWVVEHGRGPPPVLTVVVIVELDEGPWWWGRLVGADPRAVATGDRVTVDFEKTPQDVLIPVFRPA